jgi:crotonobetainyl-CoA:carnitine CoA-transferase CaiB-like acyl-CoA transferase
MFAKWCAARTVDEAVADCAREGIPCAKVRTYAEAARCPHTLERDMLQQVEQEDGKLAPITGPAAKFSRTPTRIRSGAPALGAHTDNILAELGIDADARRRLRESGVV